MAEGPKKTVLIVDDTPENIQVLRAILAGEQDYRLISATDGRRALAMARTEPVPDLILLDVRMPGMDGFQVCERLKESEDTRKIPVIFVTTMNSEEDFCLGFSLGAVDYITKPYGASLVKARIRKHLSGAGGAADPAAERLRDAGCQ